MPPIALGYNHSDRCSLYRYYDPPDIISNSVMESITVLCFDYFCFLLKFQFIYYLNTINL